MATLELSYYSKALKRYAAVRVILPEIDKKEEGVGSVSTPYKTLYLLHGLGGNRDSWLRQTNIERYAKAYGIAVVMPEVERSWYADTVYGAKYFTFITQELPQVCRSYFKGMSDKREDNFIGGLSMGGYGALKAALHYPDKYGGCISLSGSLDITRKGRECEIDLWKGLFGIKESPMELEGTDNDLFALLERSCTAELPKMFLWCGTEDVLIRVNCDFAARLGQKGAEYCFAKSEGDHTWKYWDKHIVDGLEYMLGDK